MSEAMMQPCAAAETSIQRGVRYVAGVSLMLFALAECVMAWLMYFAGRTTPQLLYLLCSLSLFVAAAIALRRRGRALIAVRALAIATAVMLFWSMSANSGPNATIRGKLHDVTPLLAGMLLAAVLLPGLLKDRDSEAACNCQ